ncbi:hypothetical protein GKZ90_0001130 [Flavobacterium sp. MC2016-06]|jgi:hypothetical protein|uniref:hypothetical protein n=1 Tax=Flavobacterium sp. MC2016-06 TaxID=2676308 RepID=UPI0012BAA4AC|nr:hypothetical protein [Flavobacterium sp. MC2016-06]MBU3859086.1 hypothetical protein [Flavobacterium sp. MC2016-06]
MENLELETKITDLGKHFVNELGLDPGVDTFSKWMAHYIAEKMALAEHLPVGKNRKVAEKESFETILKLWEHRWSLPSGKRPLENFESILKTLEKLNPEEQEPFFYHSLNYELEEMENNNPDLKEIIGFTKMASQIDKVARIWISFILSKAAQKAKNDNTESFLKNAVSLRNNDDVKAIRIVFKNDPSIDLENDTNDNVHRKFRLEKLRLRIEELENFSELNELILESYKKELEELI